MARDWTEEITVNANSDLTREFHIRAMGDTIENQQIKIDILEQQLAELSLKFAALETALLQHVDEWAESNDVADMARSYKRERDELLRTGDRDNLTIEDLFYPNVMHEPADLAKAVAMRDMGSYKVSGPGSIFDPKRT